MIHGRQNQGLLMSFAENHDKTAIAPISSKMSKSIGPLILRNPAATSAINTATASPKIPRAFPKPANSHQAPPGLAWLKIEQVKPRTDGASSKRMRELIRSSVFVGGGAGDVVMFAKH